MPAWESVKRAVGAGGARGGMPRPWFWQIREHIIPNTLLLAHPHPDFQTFLRSLKALNGLYTKHTMNERKKERKISEARGESHFLMDRCISRRKYTYRVWDSMYSFSTTVFAEPSAELKWQNSWLAQPFFSIPING